MRSLAVVAAALALSACSTLGGEGIGFSDYSLVRAQRKAVGDGSMIVTAPRPWNRHRPITFEDIRQVEDWTQNGPLLDGIKGGIHHPVGLRLEGPDLLLPPGQDGQRGGLDPAQ